MTLEHHHIAAILRGTYTTPEAARVVLEEEVLPRLPQLGKLARSSDEAEELAHEVFAGLGEKIDREQGLACPTPRRCYERWLFEVLYNRARDVQRAQRRQRANELAPPAPGSAPAPALKRLPPELVPLAHQHPLPFIGLCCWLYPTSIDRPLLEHAKARPPRARKELTTGIARSVDDTDTLLRTHEAELSAGAHDNLPVQDRFGWILRALIDWQTWLADPVETKRARATVIGWKMRAHKALRRAHAAGRVAREDF